MNALRLLLVVNGNGLSPGLGGSLMRTSAIGRELAAAGHEVHVWTTSGGRRACEELGLNARYHVLPCSLFRHTERGVADRLAAYAISTAASIVALPWMPHFDVVYSDSDYPCDVLPAYLLRLLGKGRVWVAMVHHLLQQTGDRTSRAHAWVEYFKRGVQRWGHGLAARGADAAFVYATDAGRTVAERLIEQGLDSSNVTFVHNGFDAEALRAVDPSERTYAATLVGGLRPGKGLTEVVPIWERVVRFVPDARLAVVGSILAENEAFLRSTIEKAGLAEHIVLLGGRPHREAIAYVKSSRIFFAPSLEEGWGIAVCEALALGVPVVAYDLPTYRDLFQEGMTLIPAGDRERFADAVVDLLHDEHGRAALGAKGPEAVQAYTWRRVAQSDAEQFHRLLERAV